MRCNRAEEYLSLDMDGLLPPSSTLDLQKHLDKCADCRAYREDLQMGQRLLKATEPSLPDNFDWKLQLQLNQTLKETAGEVTYPWIEGESSRKSLLNNFFPAAAVGLAAVLALAIFLGPGATYQPVEATQQNIAAQSSDRLPLGSVSSSRSVLGRPVSTSSPFQPVTSGGSAINRGWSGQNLDDLRTINHLRRENEKLSRMLLQSQRQMQLMRAPLDTTKEKDLNLGTE